jgi:hypothetical protein
VINTIDDVVARLHTIGASLSPDDGVGQFNTVYQHTTEAIQDRLAGDFFNDPAFVEHLDVVFANRYFAAVDADVARQSVDFAWQPLFNLRADARVQALQFVLAGMNSHINHDLSLATVDACVTAGTHPLAGTIPDDFHKVNEVLEDIESKTRLSLLNELEQQIDTPVEPLVHLISSWSIAQAREAAWVRVQLLWLLRAEHRLFNESVTISSKAVGMTSRHLLTPLTLSHPEIDPAMLGTPDLLVRA